jgi:transposase
MSEIATVCIDLAKSVFHIHGVDENGGVLVRGQLRRAGSYDWGRRLQEMGHDVQLMSPSL